MQGPIQSSQSFRVPAEFEPLDALVFGCEQLVRAYPQTFVDFVRLTHERVQLFGVVSRRHVRLAEILLSVAGLPKDAVTYMEADTSSMWVRDYSPISAFDEKGRRVFLNFDFRHMNGRNDGELRRVFESCFKGRFVDIPLSLEGGNLLTNGVDLVLTSKTLSYQNSGRSGGGSINQILTAVTGCRRWASVNPLNGERTGHVDLVASFNGPARLLVGQADPNYDPVNARSLDEIASALSGLDVNGKKLEVIRLPMAPSTDGVVRSYTNLLYVNGLVLVPTYPTADPELDGRVLRLFAELMPEHDVVGLDCSNIVHKGGSLHCMSMNVAKELDVEVPPGHDATGQRAAVLSQGNSG